MRPKCLVGIFIFILAILPSESGAERRGARLQIQKTDGSFLSGELIAVKKESLLLLDSDSGVDVSVALEDVEVIEIVKKPKVLFGAGLGLVFGAGIGAASGYILGDDEPREGDEQGDFKTRTAGEKALINGILFGLIGVIGGGLVGADMGKDEAIYFQGMPPDEKAEYLQKLSSKARIRNLK